MKNSTSRQPRIDSYLALHQQSLVLRLQGKSDDSLARLHEGEV